MEFGKMFVRAFVIIVGLFSVSGIAAVFAQAPQGSQEASSQQTSTAAPQQQQIPVIDGGLGPCSVDITVKRPGGKVVDAAKVTVHIAYGFLNVRRLDLEVPTNNQGKARITGLPNNLKHGLLLHGYKDNLLGTAFVDPSKNCEARHEMVLVQQAPSDQDEAQSPAPDNGTDNKGTNTKDTEKNTSNKDSGQNPQ
jgi:hypothetical protein